MRPSAFPTTYGMGWYPEGGTSRIFVERTATHRGMAVLTVRTSWEGVDDPDNDKGERLQLTVSAGGRSVRVYDRRGREWRPVEETE